MDKRQKDLLEKLGLHEDGFEPTNNDALIEEAYINSELALAMVMELEV